MIPYDESYNQLLRELEKFIESHKDLLAEEWDDDLAQARSILKALAEARLIEYVVPAAYGGRGDKVRARLICLAREKLAYEHALADLMFAMQGLGSYPITLAGSERLKSRYLPAVAKGEKIAAFALTEPAAGSDVAGISTLAVRTADEYLITGTKTYISNAGIADFYVVFAKTDPQAGKNGISALVVDADQVTVRALRMLSAHPIGEVTFNCRVPTSQLLGVEGEGFKIAMQTLDLFRPTVGAAAVGLGRRALAESLEYAKRRMQFGKRLADFQAIRFKLADMYTQLEAAALMVERAAYVVDRGVSATLESSAAKLFATEAAQYAVDECLQIHGASGLLKGAVAERLYRDLRAMRIYEGTSEIQRIVIANQLLKGSV
ncbi:MAG: acyl-CoA dehydrogenase family protein [Acidobacteriota bacterium]|nr:acyl-CoA dehydrogenase family protein [Blastocatellia bacterium]MDW8413656.1 acyl-CoA dehydrogenase family protein [Acidobacteriota bacterium]